MDYGLLSFNCGRVRGVVDGMTSGRGVLGGDRLATPTVPLWAWSSLYLTSRGPTRLHEHKHAGIPLVLTWAFEPECRILVFMWPGITKPGPQKDCCGSFAHVRQASMWDRSIVTQGRYRPHRDP